MLNLLLYKLRYDGETFYVEASGLLEAIRVWKAFVAELWPMPGQDDREPQAVELVSRAHLLRCDRLGSVTGLVGSITGESKPASVAAGPADVLLPISSYDFQIELTGDSGLFDRAEAMLPDSRCADATLSMWAGVVGLSFTRLAVSYEQAVQSVLADLPFVRLGIRGIRLRAC